MVQLIEKIEPKIIFDEDRTPGVDQMQKSNRIGSGVKWQVKDFVNQRVVFPDFKSAGGKKGE